MICFTAKGYQRLCGGTTGGLSDVLIYDPSDFNFTQAVGGITPYTAVALRTGATAAGGGLMFRITFQEKEAERKFTQSRNGCAVKYDHEINMQLPQLSDALTAFLQSLDAAGCCCGLGFAVRHNDGKIFILGEKYVNNDEITKFSMVQDGTTGGSGKLFEDVNGANVVFKGSYSREAREYTGTWASLVALTTVPVTP